MTISSLDEWIGRFRGVLNHKQGLEGHHGDVVSMLGEEDCLVW